MKQKGKQAGIALVVIIWFIALLSLLSLGFSKVMRSEALIARNLVESIQAKHLAAAAIEQGIFKLLLQDPAAQMATIKALPVDFSFGDAKLSYRLQDENGKLDINLAAVELIENLLIAVGATKESALSISHAIEDWRDADDFRQLFGAERHDYSDVNMAWVPSNAPFRSIHEVRHVMGVTADIFKMIAPLITVYNASDKINPKFASRALLQAIPGIDAVQLENYILARESFTPEDNPDMLPLLTSIDAALSAETGPIYTIIGQVELASGMTTTRRLVVWLTGETGDSPYFVMDSGQDYPPAAVGRDQK